MTIFGPCTSLVLTKYNTFFQGGGYSKQEVLVTVSFFVIVFERLLEFLSIVSDKLHPDFVAPQIHISIVYHCYTLDF